ncbi:ABC transporter permease [Candidatus Saccharibacteria bacterium]|nr:ABC transporter permease [Candidatus Saccharibacteria bacterium]
MKVSDYTLLAYTKIKTRKLRSVLTMISMAIVFTGLITASFAYNGGLNAMRDASPANLKDKYILAQDDIKVIYDPTNQPDNMNNTSPKTTVTEPNSIISNFGQEYGIKAVYEGFGTPDEVMTNDEVSCYDDSSWATTCVDTTYVMSAKMFEYYTTKALDQSAGVYNVLVSDTYARYLAKQDFKEGDDDYAKMAKQTKSIQAVLGNNFELKITVDAYQYPEGLPISAEDEPPEPETRPISVNVVGIVPSPSLINEIAGIFSYNNGRSSGVYFSDQNYPSSINLAEVKNGNFGSYTLFPEFDNISNMQRYIAEQKCNESAYSGPDACWAPEGTKPYINYFNTYDLAFIETGKQVLSFARIVLGIVAIGVAFSIASTTSKVILDSRKEIGVFRAIGAKRRQISGIYNVYIAMLVISALMIALVIARLIIGFLDIKYADKLSTQIALFNASPDPHGHFSFFGIDLYQLLLIGIFAILIGLIGASFPVLRSLKKDTLRYLRED